MTQRAGLIGEPINHSRSPAMHNAAFAALGIAARYDLWPATAATLAERISALRAPGMLGANVTIPHKLAAMALVDQLTPSALAVGAVNTIVARGGPLIGHNTDADGLAAALRAAGRERVAAGVILGAGGAARAALLALRALGATRITVATRGPAAGLGADVTMTRLPVGAPASGELADALATAAIVINATPVGTADAPGLPLAGAWLAVAPAGTLALDLIVAETAWLAAARARGLATMTGGPMLLWQGALAFTLWTDQPAPLAVMRAALGDLGRG